MMKSKVSFAVVGITVAVLSILLLQSLNVVAEEATPKQQAAREAISKELNQTLGMPILKGDLWQKMSHDEKVAFVWGFGHVVSIEQYLMEKYPELKREGFVAKVIEGMSNTPMNEVIAKVDTYYQAHPDEIDKPVTSVMWDTMIRPNIKTGIAGRQLSRTP